MTMEPTPTRSSSRTRWVMAVVWLVIVGFIVFCADRQLFRPFFHFITSYPGLDKVGHFCLIGGTSFLLNLALGMRTWPAFGRRWLIGSILVAVAFTAEEFTQLWFPSRTFDLLDLTADFAGILFFGWLARRVSAPRPQV